MSTSRAEELEEGIVRPEKRKVSRDQRIYCLLFHVGLHTKSNGESLEGRKQRER